MVGKGSRIKKVRASGSVKKEDQMEGEARSILEGLYLKERRGSQYGKKNYTKGRESSALGSNGRKREPAREEEHMQGGVRSVLGSKGKKREVSTEKGLHERKRKVSTRTKWKEEGGQQGKRNYIKGRESSAHGASGRKMESSREDEHMQGRERSALGSNGRKREVSTGRGIT